MSKHLTAALQNEHINSCIEIVKALQKVPPKNSKVRKINLRALMMKASSYLDPVKQILKATCTLHLDPIQLEIGE